MDSLIFSENIKWNLSLRNNSVKALLVNTRNANAFTGKQGFKGIVQIAEELSKQLTIKITQDEENINSVKPNQILFGCTGTIGETFPTEKIMQSIPTLIKKIKHPKIKSANDDKLKEFDKKLHSVLLNLAKRIAADGEGASKFVSVNVLNAKTFIDAKNIAFSIANSPLVKTAIAGEDPNWGRIIMAIGKANVQLNLEKLAINFGKIKVIEKGQLLPNYEEIEVAEYMRGKKIDLTVDLNIGNKNFTAYTMDLTKKYIEINADYRS